MIVSSRLLAGAAALTLLVGTAAAPSFAAPKTHHKHHKHHKHHGKHHVKGHHAAPKMTKSVKTPAAK